MGATQQPTILVTGGAGYIGSHASQLLESAGYKVVILDSLVYGHRDLVEQVLDAELIVGNINDEALLNHIFATYSIEAVMHFAAYAYVGESVRKPAKYYINNVSGTLTLLEAMKKASVRKLVFSSTCATYGIPDTLPITENHPQKPINPYGKSKLMVEQLLADFDHAHGIKSVIFRYFNAAGADPAGRLGEDHHPETHLIPLLLQEASSQQKSISILGTDYPTPDGTCIRDYIHVVDLARAHVLGLEYLFTGANSQVFNLSNGNGFSVKEVIEETQRVTGCTIYADEKERRLGDPPILIGCSHKAREILGWQPQYPGLQEIIRHAWNWHQRRHGGTAVTCHAAEAHRQSSTSMPLVSVIIPAYNAAAFIEKTLESVQAQTYRNLEILVVDDGSCDQTVDIVRQFSKEDSRIRLLQQANAGVAAARNLAIASAKGTFIAPIDADDIWYPENIAQQVNAIQKGGPNVALAYAWSVYIDAENTPVGGFKAAQITGDVYTTLIGHNFIGNASATVIRRSCLEAVGGYDTTLRERNAQGCEDWALYLRIAEKYEFQAVPKFLVGYRKLSGSMSCDYQSMARSHALVMSSVQAKYPNIPKYLFQMSASNLYIYFAHQSDQQKRHRTTRFWLKKAIRGGAFSLMKIGFYRLLLSSYWGTLTKKLIKPFSRNGVTLQLDSPQLTSRIAQSTATSITQPLKEVTGKNSTPHFKAPQVTLYLMIMVGNSFHYIIGKLTKGLSARTVASAASPSLTVGQQ